MLSEKNVNAYFVSLKNNFDKFIERIKGAHSQQAIIDGVHRVLLEHFYYF